jgi:hypothetical protein
LHPGGLAASSKFFAYLLPEGELENEICIFTELVYSELFCILEYIYSGKLLCSLQQKDEILSLLKEYQVFVPDNLSTVGANSDESELIDIGLPSVTPKMTDIRRSNDRQFIEVSSPIIKNLDHNYVLPQIARDVEPVTQPNYSVLEVSRSSDDDSSSDSETSGTESDSSSKSDSESDSDNRNTDKENDHVDSALADHYLQQQKKIKKKLNLKVRRHLKSLSQ